MPTFKIANYQSLELNLSWLSVGRVRFEDCSLQFAMRIAVLTVGQDSEPILATGIVSIGKRWRATKQIGSDVVATACYGSCTKTLA